MRRLLSQGWTSGTCPWQNERVVIASPSLHEFTLSKNGAGRRLRSSHDRLHRRNADRTLGLRASASAVDPSPGGLLRVRRRLLRGGTPALAPRRDRRSHPVPVYVDRDRHVGHPRARPGGPGRLRAHHRRLPERVVCESGWREHRLQPRAFVAQVLRLPERRVDQHAVYGRACTLPVQRQLQLIPRQHAVPYVQPRLRRAPDRVQRRSGWRNGHLSR